MSYEYYCSIGFSFQPLGLITILFPIGLLPPVPSPGQAPGEGDQVEPDDRRPTLQVHPGAAGQPASVRAADATALVPDAPAAGADEGGP